jgi:hypothetical protein
MLTTTPIDQMKVFSNELHDFNLQSTLCNLHPTVDDGGEGGTRTHDILNANQAL